MFDYRPCLKQTYLKKYKYKIAKLKLTLPFILKILIISILGFKKILSKKNFALKQSTKFSTTAKNNFEMCLIIVI